MLSHSEYDAWIILAPEEPKDIEASHVVDENGVFNVDLVRTLYAHVQALLERIDKLMDPDQHDRMHGRGCKCYQSRCACAYDYPTDVCMIHGDPRTHGYTSHGWPCCDKAKPRNVAARAKCGGTSRNFACPTCTDEAARIHAPRQGVFSGA